MESAIPISIYVHELRTSSLTLLSSRDVVAGAADAEADRFDTSSLEEAEEAKEAEEEISSKGASLMKRNSLRANGSSKGIRISTDQ